MRRLHWALMLAILTGWLLLQPLAVAQSTSTETTEQLTQDLKLTQDQQNQVKAINEQRRNQIQSVMKDSSLTPEQKRERIREINQSSDSQIRGLLTPEQQQRWDRRDRRENVRDRREDVRDRREDVRDRREDVRDRRTDGGPRDRLEDRRDRREDVRDRAENKRDRREDRRDRRRRP